MTAKRPLRTSAIRIALAATAIVGVSALVAIYLSGDGANRGQPASGAVVEAAQTTGPGGATGGGASGPRIVGYRSTMLPEVSPTPRKDSMGMDMVPVYEARGSMLELSEHARAMASVETVPVRRRRLTRDMRVIGKVQYDETRLATITSRVEGYAEHLFVRFTGAEVKRGDRLVEIYSPDLVIAQQELLTVLDFSRSSNLVESSTRKLLRWGITQAQIDELKRHRKIHERLTLVSPIEGTVTERMVVEQSAVKPGEVLYRVANLDTVWVYLDIYEFELPWVRYGQPVEIKSEAVPGQTFAGRVGFINPVLNEDSRTVKVLVSIDNTQKMLKPGMFVSATIRAELLADGKAAPTGAEGLWTCPTHPFVLQKEPGQCPSSDVPLVQIPDGPKPGSGKLPLAVPLTAVLDSGLRKLVYVEKAKGQFVPVEIELGPRTDDAYLVLSGLNEGDLVVARGNVLLDSQFQIRGLPSLFYKEGQGPAGSHAHDAASPDGTGTVPSSTAPGSTVSPATGSGDPGHQQHTRP
jgi:Cu(I)/Ag(I) efflux system membrane fusion protein